MCSASWAQPGPWSGVVWGGIAGDLQPGFGQVPGADAGKPDESMACCGVPGSTGHSPVNPGCHEAVG